MHMTTVKLFFCVWHPAKFLNIEQPPNVLITVNIIKTPANVPLNVEIDSEQKVTY